VVEIIDWLIRLIKEDRVRKLGGGGGGVVIQEELCPPQCPLVTEEHAVHYGGNDHGTTTNIKYWYSFIILFLNGYLPLSRLTTTYDMVKNLNGVAT